MTQSSLTTATLHAIPNGKEGIRVTLKFMKQLVKTGKQSLPVRLKALDIVNNAGLKQKDFIGEVKALHQYVRDHIRYVKDIRNVETLQTPDKTLELKQGDCDDKSILLASLLESIGHPTKFVAMSQQAGKFCHVFVETKIGKKWIAAETTEPVELGWRPKMYEALVIHND